MRNLVLEGAIRRLKKDVKMMEKSELAVHYYKKDKDQLAFDIEILITELEGFKHEANSRND